MKKIYLIFCLLLAALTSNASHMQGADIRYEYTGTGNLYRVYLSVYGDCSVGAAALYTTETVTFSSSCGNFSRTLQLVSSDTSKSMWCPGTNAYCGSNYLVSLVGKYIDTVTLAPCTNWKIGFTDGSRSNAITNINNPSMYNIYVEAFLNNSLAPNSSPIFDEDAQTIEPLGSIVTVPFHMTDLDGDSLSGAMMAPYSMATIAIPYGAGYSLSSPFGTGSIAQLNVANSNLKISSASTGRYVLALRVSDYRNNVLVGYSSRDWNQAITPATNPKAPFPAAGTNFNTSTCPGQSSSYTVNFMDSVATDSVYLAFTPPNNGITYTTSYSSGIASASATISWTTPSTYNVASNPYFIIKVFARDNKCPMNGYGTYNILVHVGQCNTDTVWAGDANADKVVNMYDPLAIAVAYGSTGPLRAGASTAWAPQWCANWASSFLNTANYKHADCDGNGTVNNSDLGAVTSNYGMSHPKEVYQQLARGTANPDLYFDHSGLSIAPGATVSIPIKLGGNVSLSNFYGIATRINVQGITPGSMSITYPTTSWVGTAANTVRFAKSTNSNSIDWAYARNDHQNVTGQGTMAMLTFTIPAGTAGQQVVLTMNNTKMITKTGADITAYNVLSDTFHIYPAGIAGMQSVISSAVVLPNPSHGAATLQIGLTHSATLTVSVTDVTGRLVWESGNKSMNTGTQDITLPSHLQGGMYLVHMSTGNGAQVVKWMKE